MNDEPPGERCDHQHRSCAESGHRRAGETQCRPQQVRTQCRAARPPLPGHHRPAEEPQQHAPPGAQHPGHAATVEAVRPGTARPESASQRSSSRLRAYALPKLAVIIIKTARCARRGPAPAPASGLGRGPGRRAPALTPLPPLISLAHRARKRCCRLPSSSALPVSSSRPPRRGRSLRSRRMRSASPNLDPAPAREDRRLSRKTGSRAGDGRWLTARRRTRSGLARCGSRFTRWGWTATARRSGLGGKDDRAAVEWTPVNSPFPSRDRRRVRRRVATKRATLG